MGRISAGSYDLNKWLRGGYESDIVTVIYGGSGTGKTNLCLLAAISQAKRGKKVIFIDTEGGFSVERVMQVIENWKNGDNSIDEEEVLKNILLLKPTSFSEQKEAFKQLSKNLKEDSKDEIGLIVVDGMTILYRLDFAAARDKDDSGGGIQKINSELAEQIKILAEIARKKEIPVIVTNQVYKFEDIQNMVGGDILKYWGKCHIELVHDKGRRAAILRKHRSLGESELVFVIDNAGIRKRGWI